jgi:hypothetical protein
MSCDVTFDHFRFVFFIFASFPYALLASPLYHTFEAFLFTFSLIFHFRPLSLSLSPFTLIFVYKSRLSTPPHRRLNPLLSAALLLLPYLPNHNLLALPLPPSLSLSLSLSVVVCRRPAAKPLCFTSLSTPCALRLFFLTFVFLLDSTFDSQPTRSVSSFSKPNRRQS